MKFLNKSAYSAQDPWSTGHFQVLNTRRYGDLRPPTSSSSRGDLGALQAPRYSTVQYSINMIQYSTVQYSTVQYSTVQYSTVQYSTVQYSTVQYSTVQYSTVTGEEDGVTSPNVRNLY